MTAHSLPLVQQFEGRIPPIGVVILPVERGYCVQKINEHYVDVERSIAVSVDTDFVKKCCLTSYVL